MGGFTEVEGDSVDALPPLSDVTVIDCAWLMPGQFCSMILADLGARVIKIELPGGDYARDLDEAAWATLNRGKEGLALDLRQTGAAEVLHRLASKADVFIEGFRPGVADRLDAGFDALSAHNPALVYCSISGFGQSGSKRDVPAHGLNYAGISGLLSFAGSGVRLAANVADIAAALYAAISVVTCLRRRDQTGTGQYIDLSITDASFGLMTAQLAGQRQMPSPPPGAFGVFTCGDGRQITLGAVEQQFWRALCVSVDRPDWLGDARFADESSRRTYGDDLRAELAAVMKARTSDQWLEVLERAEIPSSPVNDYVEAVNDSYAVDRNIVSWVHQRGIGEIPQVKFPAQFSTSTLRAGRRAPEIGEHTDLLLKELGYSQSDIEGLHAAGAISADRVP